MQDVKRSPIKGIMLMLICALFWSTSGVLIKSIPCHIMVLMGWRAFFAVIALYICLRLSGFKPILNKKTITIGLCVSTTSILFLIANRLTTAANAIVLQYTSPVFIVIISMILFKRKYRIADYIVIAVTFVGIMLLFVDELQPGSTLGNIIALVDGLCMGAVFLFTGEADERTRLSGILYGVIIAALIGLPFTFAYPPELSLENIGGIAFMGIFQLGLPYFIYSVALNHCPTLACSLIGSVELILNPLWVWLQLNEAPDTFAFIGAGVIFLAITVWCAFGGATPKNTLTISEQSPIA